MSRCWALTSLDPFLSLDSGTEEEDIDHRNEEKENGRNSSSDRTPNFTHR